jgi:hypothetical protein
MLLFLHSTELLVNQAAIRKPVTATAGNTDLQRLECLQNCFAATKAWNHVFFNLPDMAYLELPAVAFLQLQHVLMSLYELTTLDDPVWDRDAVRRENDYFKLAEQVAGVLDRLPHLMGSPGGPEEDVLKRAAWDIRFEYGGKVFDDGRPDAPKYGPASPSAVAVPAQLPMSEDEDADFVIDDQWLSDMLRTYD